jgi:ubiquinone/menaquinone biosynthesis C-methylase UbiE
VIGTDLSPIQPPWIPANVKFEIEDAAFEWTFGDSTFDFIHMRYLLGGISDWPTLFKQAYRCCKPGGWAESFEVDTTLYSDDGSTDGHPVIAKWNDMYCQAAKKMGRSFNVPADDLQRKGMEDAGFAYLNVINFKVGPQTVCRRQVVF